MIHRYHQSGQTEILNAFRDYPGPFDLSFKYSIAHMYSIPNPPFIQPAAAESPGRHEAPGSPCATTTSTASAGATPPMPATTSGTSPGPDKIAGFYMGPDGYTWGREFLSTEPDTPRQLGDFQTVVFVPCSGARLSYEPDLPDSLFRATLAARFPAGRQREAVSRLGGRVAGLPADHPLLLGRHRSALVPRSLPEPPAAIAATTPSGISSRGIRCRAAACSAFWTGGARNWPGQRRAASRLSRSPTQLEERAGRALEALPSLRASGAG